MTEISLQVNLDCLRSLYADNPVAKAVLDHLASRERNWRSTSVDRIQANVKQNGYDVSRGDIIVVFRELEQCGCGVFRSGRRGWPSRFEWAVNMVDVGKAAAGEIEEVSDVSQDDVEEEPTGSHVEHPYRLRPDTVVTFELPLDLTHAEAKRLADFIQTLPFSGDDKKTV